MQNKRSIVSAREAVFRMPDGAVLGVISHAYGQTSEFQIQYTH